MRIVRLKRTDTDAEYFTPLAAVESIADVLGRVPNGIPVVVELEEMAEADYHEKYAGSLRSLANWSS